MIADIGLGSNMGNRLSYLQWGLDGLRHAGCEIVAVSQIYETDPVGGPEQGAFLNACVRVGTTLTPDDLLDVCLRIESRAGRVRRERWGPRTLDLDILRLCDDLGIELRIDNPPRLVVPHPRAGERPFVTVLLADLDARPDERTAAGGDTPAGVRRTELQIG